MMVATIFTLTSITFFVMLAKSVEKLCETY